MDSLTFAQFIGALLLLQLVFSIINYAIQFFGGAKKNAVELSQIRNDLNTLKDRLSEIKVNTDKYSDEHGKFRERLVVLERDIKTFWTSYDGLKTLMDNLLSAVRSINKE